MKHLTRNITASIVAIILCLVMSFGVIQVFADETPQADASAQSEAQATEAAPATNSDYQRLTIKEAGTYVLTGSMHGSVYVDPGEGDVILVLDNADIDGGDEPGIMAVSGDHLKIEIKDHTLNRIADGPNNPWQAAIYTEVDTVLDGNCRLLIEGKSGHGIVTKNADFTVNGGRGLIIAEKSGFKADGDTPGHMIFKGGVIYVNAKEGIFAEGTVSEMLGGKVEATTETCIRKLFPECEPCASPCKPCSHKCECEGECESECELEPTVDEPLPIVEGMKENSAGDLEPDYEHAIRIVLSDDNNELSISTPGTYIVSGSCKDGQITVAKETEGVILVLENLNLTNVSGPALAINDEAEVKIIVEGDVKLATGKSKDESEEETADAAIVGGDKTNVVITGDCGSKLVVDGGDTNGISMGEDSSLVIDGDLGIAITAGENGITSEYDVAVLDSNMFIKAEDAGIHADHVITVGDEDECGPCITVRGSEDGLEATVINVESGHLDLCVEKDGLDADEDLYDDDDLEASVNITGGCIRINAGEQGIESDSNVNLIDGTAVISSEDDCVEFGDDLYVSDDFEIYSPCGSDSCEPGKG